MVLRSIGVLSCGKIMGAFYALIGLVAGGLLTLASLTGAASQMVQNGADPVLPFMALGAFAIIFLPMLYGAFGFVGGIIGAAMYNLVAGIVGGLELNLQPRSQPYTAA